jgi:hypothetical protein
MLGLGVAEGGLMTHTNNGATYEFSFLPTLIILEAFLMQEIGGRRLPVGFTIFYKYTHSIVFLV